MFIVSFSIYTDYLFPNDYDDPGQHSSETIALLLALMASFYFDNSSTRFHFVALHFFDAIGYLIS